MDEQVDNNESLIGRIQQLERERDELRKDIEQLCLQQAGPSYLVVATRMHFQRTAGLEQEIENLKKKLAVCTRDNLNLQEELSEVYRIKSQLADLHSAEVSKNMEAEKQVKFFQGCVAAAFAERDHSIMEAEKAKEREEFMSQKLNDFQKRLEELSIECLKEKELHARVQIDLAKLEEQNGNLMEVIYKFYQIRQSTLGISEDSNWDDKCACLLQDPVDMWSFNTNIETSTSKYIDSLEGELEMLRNSVDNLQNKLRVGLEIENHLKKKIYELEKKIVSNDMITNRISEFHYFYTQHRCDIKNLLEEGKAQFESMLDVIKEMIRQFHTNNTQKFEPLQRDENNDIECRDVHITTDAEHSAVAEKNCPSTNIMAKGMGDISDAFAQALQEKVATLLLLSQQEERHLLERNVNAALQKKIEELQRNLLRVTNEKVKALMELAQLRKEYRLLQENIDQGIQRGNILADVGDKIVAVHERDGKLKSLLKRTYLRRWVGRLDEADGHMNNEGNFTNKKSSYEVDFARMKVENATLKESIGSMNHLTSLIHKLRLSLLKAKESATSQCLTTISEALDDIIVEAKLLKTALGSSLPVSWSPEADPGSCGGSVTDEPSDGCEDSVEKVDSVSAAGFEMVELLILACQILKENIRQSFH